jgi:hypothetical protein
MMSLALIAAFANPASLAARPESSNASFCELRQTAVGREPAFAPGESCR